MLTFVTPVGPYHETLAERAIASVRAQSVACQHVVVYDREGRGAAWARNEGLRRVITPFVSFLDADDWLEPEFAEKCLLAYDGRRYVFTDWVTDQVIEAPCRPWDGRGAHHIITTLLPTVWVKRIGGFDETTYAEDSDFYWKLTRAGLCGMRLPEALFHYGRGGRRARALHDRPDRDDIMRAIVARYEGLSMAEDCNGCGGMPNVNLPGASAGDVMATTLWHGTRAERGRMTGRLYRGGWGEAIPVDPRDIDAAPHLFSRVVELPPRVSEDDLKAFRQVSAELRAAFGGSLKDTSQEPVPAYVPQGEVAPDVAQVLRLYDQR